MQDKPEDQIQKQSLPQAGMTGVRKRQQIEDTNKRIFIWLAVASVIVSICLVALQFLIREFMFNQKIINKKSETNSILVKNIKEADLLRDNVNALLADANLSSLKYTAPNAKTTALNVVLDALPIEGDSTAFANSLQAVILARSGVAIRELNTSVVGSEGYSSSPEAPTAAESSAEPLPLPFTAGFTGKYADIEKALTDISKVIRPINLNQLTIKSTENDQLQVTIGGVTYYLPAKTIEIKTEEVRP